MTAQPWRSVLYVPGDKPRAIDKARTLTADAIIFDLEDAVAPEHKAAARDNVAAAWQSGPWPCPVLLRVNGTGTAWHTDDLTLAAKLPLAGLVLPKVESREAIAAVPGEWPLWAMIETPLGVLHAQEVAAEERVVGLIAGANDLARALRARPGPQRLPLLPALSQVVLAARAYGKVPLDAVYNDIRNEEGFAQECHQGRDLGFAGKTLIHPAQVPAANREFGVSEEQAQHARALLAAWEAAREHGQSVATLEGALIEQMHVDEAQETLALYDRISGAV